MNIFVSFFPYDSEDLARHIFNHFKSAGHSVLISSKEIQMGDTPKGNISEQIATCDLFLVIITKGALNSNYVEKEVLEALRYGKWIIPCIYCKIPRDNVHWDLQEVEFLEFSNHISLLRELDKKISESSN